VGALPWAAAREVAPRPPLARLPGAPPVVSGVVNVRGAFVPLVELEALLGHEPAPRPAGWIVVVEHGAQAVAIGVEALPELRDAEPSAAAGTTAPRPREVCVEGRELPLLDAADLVARVLH
jgi:purine-binding chemotaxis protein CheW